MASNGLLQEGLTLNHNNAKAAEISDNWHAKQIYPLQS